MKLFVVEFDSSGGLIHYAYQLCTVMADQGIDTRLITGTDYELAAFPHTFKVEQRMRLWPRHSSSTAPQEGLTRLRQWFHKCSRLLRRGGRGVKLIREWWGLTNHIIKEKPDVVQFSEIHFFFEALFLMKLRRHNIHLCQICHEFEHREQHGFFKPFITRLNALTFKNFSAIFFLSQHTRDSFLATYQYPEGCTHLIPHGNESLFLKNTSGLKKREDLRELYKITADELVVLFFGTLIPSKGVYDLIDAFAQARVNCKAKLVIAGYPSKFIDLQQLRKQIKEHGLAEDVVLDLRYLPIESIGQLMDLATVVVFPYRSSTQSGALQVAYTFGRPVIASSVGGISEVVEDGRSGFLVPPKRPDKLAERIEHVLSSPKIREEMGVHARHLSETRYSWKPIAEKIIKIYSGLLRE